ncbi:hypothetical protein MPSEU_000849300 [Mayamaea pseudoterrestris]|nr:hypothetical protein MPSEU_000849300 [Mayamaea pseudoterrestris]
MNCAEFHHIPITVLPFVANPLVHFYPPGWNIFLVILLLSLLMRNTKCGKMTVLCGIFIGSYWTDGISSFLGDAYYGKAWIASLGLATALSYKASYRDSLPCIDSVGWDQRGRLLHESSSMEIVVVDGELLLVEAADYDDDAESLDENADDDDEFYIENLHEGHGDIELPPGTDDASSYGRTNDMAFDDNGSEEQQSLLPTNRRRGRSTRTQSGRRRR